MENNSFSNEMNVIRKDLRSTELRLPSVKQVSLLYSISVIILMFLASRVQHYETFSGLLITEVILILPMPLMLLFYGKYDLKRVLRINKIGPLNVFLIFCLMFCAFWVVNILNTWYLLLIKSIFGYVKASGVPPAADAKSLVIYILIIGVSAGVCEEVMFRGTIMRSFERFGAYKAIFITAVLFGLWHMYFTSFFGTFILGLLIGFIVYRSNSIFGGMFAHFTHNTLSVVFPYIILKISKLVSSDLGDLGNKDIDKTLTDILNLPKPQLITTFVVQGLMILFVGVVFTGIMIAFIRTTANQQEKVIRERVSGHKKNLLWLLPGLAFIGFMYYALGLSLLGIKIPIVTQIIKILGLG